MTNVYLMQRKLLRISSRFSEIDFAVSQIMIDEAKSKLKDSPGAGVKRKGGPDSSGGQVSDCLEGKKNPCAPIISFR